MKFERFISKISTRNCSQYRLYNDKRGFLLLFYFVCFWSALNETAPWVTLPISRVLSWAIIYLRLTSPSSFGFRRATRGYMSGKRSPCGVASDRVYSKERLPAPWVSSYLAFPSLPSCLGGLFLLHFPGSCLRLTLSVILPYEARTFLTVIPFGAIPRDRSIGSGILYINF